MKGIRAAATLLLCMTLMIGTVSLGIAGEQRTAPITQYQGQIRSIKIDRCGLQPGTCEGSIVLAQSNASQVTLAIKPGTWIKRGDHLVLIEELEVGNYVQARAAKIAGSDQATNIEVLTTP